MPEILRGYGGPGGTVREPTRTVEDEQKQPTSKWRLEYFPKGSYFVVRDEEGKAYRTITGHDAAILKRILTVRNQKVTDDMVDAYRPLVLEVFKGEMGLEGEDQAYGDEIKAKQPRQHGRETPEEVYQRYWMGHLMPNGITAEDVAEKIIKGQDRVRVEVALGRATEGFLKEKIDELASVIKEFHPKGLRGK